jgi:hypothetical protein
MTDHSERREHIKAYLRKDFDLNLDDHVEEYLQAELEAESWREEEARRARELRDMSDGDLIKRFEKERARQPWRTGYAASTEAELARRLKARQPKPSVHIINPENPQGVIIACEDLPGAEEAVAEELEKMKGSK